MLHRRARVHRGVLGRDRVRLLHLWQQRAACERRTGRRRHHWRHCGEHAILIQPYNLWTTLQPGPPDAYDVQRAVVRTVHTVHLQ